MNDFQMADMYLSEQDLPNPDQLNQPSGESSFSCFERIINPFFANIQLISDRLTSVPEMLAPHPKNQTVPYGGMVSFQCKIKSIVQPHIQVANQG